MCVSLAPAKFSSTILYGYEINVPGRIAHVLGYQNQVQNLVPSPNAMILPFLALPSSMTKANVIDTSSHPHILKDMAATVMPRFRGAMLLGSTKSASVPPKVEIFHSGIYTVVLATDATLIHNALRYVPEVKRPRINNEIFDAYAAWYPEWTVALCCFNNGDAKTATPMLWHYEPMDNSSLFLPALDCHSGEVPNLNEKVVVDHTVVVGSNLMQIGNGSVVHYSDYLSDKIRPFLADEVIGRQIKGMLSNGDFFIKIGDVRNGNFALTRKAPIS